VEADDVRVVWQALHLPESQTFENQYRTLSENLTNGSNEFYPSV